MNGAASFTDLTLIYSATADHESFTLQASSGELTSAQSDALTANVVATRLVFVTQPEPLSVTSGALMDFSVDPVVQAQDADGLLDEDFTQTVTLSTKGAGMGDLTNKTAVTVKGSVIFNDLTITYHALNPPEMFNLSANGGDLHPGESQMMSCSLSPPPVLSLSSPSIQFLGSPIFLDDQAAVSDPDSVDLNQGRLMVEIIENGTENDRLGLDVHACDEEHLLVIQDGNQIEYNGGLIGAFSGGDGKTPLIVAFTSEKASLDAAQSLIRCITYEHISPQTEAADRLVRLFLDDGDGGVSAPVLKTIFIDRSPRAFPDAISVLEDQIVLIDVLSNDSDPDGDDLTLTSIAEPPHNGAAAILQNQIQYLPLQDFSGVDRLTYTIDDGRGLTDAAVVEIFVQPVNDKPSCSISGNQLVQEDAASPIVTPFVTHFDPGGGADEENQTSVYEVSILAGEALFSMPPLVDPAGVLSYALAENAYGTSRLEIIARDNGGTAFGGVDSSDPASFFIKVAPVNDVPIAQSQLLSTREDES
ncbi:MAG: cadherin-like domain-containing protein, partial [Candidatus Hinthialibacter sp.]